MKIERTGARSIDWAPFANEMEISNIRINNDKNIELELNKVPGKGGFYHFKVTLTPDDIGKIVTEFYKQALTKK